MQFRGINVCNTSIEPTWLCVAQKCNVTTLMVSTDCEIWIGIEFIVIVVLPLSIVLIYCSFQSRMSNVTFL